MMKLLYYRHFQEDKNNTMDYSRYERQIVLDDFGKDSQDRLAAANVLVIGAGGLGCTVLLQLAAIGIGQIGIVDYDKVELSNLHRQILYNEQCIGKYKVDIAKEKLLQLNSTIKIETYNEYIQNKNVLKIFQSYDLVIDCSDNFQTRYMINDACVLLNKVLIYGAIYQYEGQVTIFNVEKNSTHSANYRDLFPVPPKPDEAPNCNVTGALGLLCNIIGNIQATEAIKYIIGKGDLLANKILNYNLLTHEQFIFEYIKQMKIYEVHENIDAFMNFSYIEFCRQEKEEIAEIDVLKKILKNDKCVLVDVREVYDLPKIEFKNVLHIPIYEIENKIDQLEMYDTIVFVCQHSNRSQQALILAKQKYPNKLCYFYTLGAAHINLEN